MEQITPTQSKSYYYLGSILVSIATLVFIALLTLESLLGRAQELYVYSFVTLTLLVSLFIRFRKSRIRFL